MRKIILNIIIIGTTLFIAGCNKLLEVEPDLRTQINTIDKVSQLVADAYPGYGYLAMAETYSDNVNDKGPDASGAALLDPYVDLYFWRDVSGSGNNTPTQYWNSCYQAIAAANHALQAIEKYDFGDKVLPYKGEALVARAYAHFMLVTFFAKAYDIKGDNKSPGIPYVTEPEDVTLKSYERGTVASVYQQIEKDLEDGIPLLKGGSWKVPKYHFTYAAANAFASRFYLFKGEWDKVISHANEVFPAGNYAGQTRPENTVIRDWTSAQRVIEYTKADKNYNLLLAHTYSVYQRQSTGYYSRYHFGNAKYTEYFVRSTAAGAAFTWNGSNYRSGTHYWTNKYNEYFYYTNVAAGTGQPYIMVPLITADEALANRAEAYAMKNNYAKSIEDLDLFVSTRINSYNPVTHKVSLEKSRLFFDVEDDTEALVQTVLQFKQRAFVMEGIRWLDIVRHGITVKHSHIDALDNETYQELKPDDNRRMFQIPKEATLAGIELNPR